MEALLVHGINRHIGAAELTRIVEGANLDDDGRKSLGEASLYGCRIRRRTRA